MRGREESHREKQRERETGDKKDRQTGTERMGKKENNNNKNKETIGCRTEHSAHRKYTHTVCTVTTYTMIYVGTQIQHGTRFTVDVDQSLQGKTS